MELPSMLAMPNPGPPSGPNAPLPETLKYARLNRPNTRNDWLAVKSMRVSSWFCVNGPEPEAMKLLVTSLLVGGASLLKAVSMFWATGETTLAAGWPTEVAAAAVIGIQLGWVAQPNGPQNGVRPEPLLAFP